MEIQPPSSIAEATANYTGWTQDQVDNAIRRIWPFRAINTLKHSSDTLAAVSSTGLATEFRDAERAEGYRMLQGIVQNPWSSIHDVEIGKMDPYYMSLPSQDLTDLYQKTIGKPTGVSEVADPRLTFVENLLKLKEFQRGMDNEHSYAYLQNLFMTQVDNGKSYYQKQAQKQQQSFSDHMIKKLANTTTVDDHEHRKQTHITRGIVKAYPNQGKRNIRMHTHGIYQHNPKRAKLDALHDRFAPKSNDELVEHVHQSSNIDRSSVPYNEARNRLMQKLPPRGPYVETNTIPHESSTPLSLEPPTPLHNPQERVPTHDMEASFVPLSEEHEYKVEEVDDEEQNAEAQYAQYIEDYLDILEVDSIHSILRKYPKAGVGKTNNMSRKAKKEQLKLGLSNAKAAEIWNRYAQPGGMATPNTVVVSDDFQLGNQSRYVK